MTDSACLEPDPASTSASKNCCRWQMLLNKMRRNSYLLSFSLSLVMFKMVKIHRQNLKDQAKINQMRVENLKMFGFDEALAYLPPVNSDFKLIETYYPLMDGSYFSPFNTTKAKNDNQDRQDRENNKIVCWNEGLCYEYIWPSIKPYESEQEAAQKCDLMTKVGSRNTSPYPVYFRGVVGWNGNETRQWTTNFTDPTQKAQVQGCLPKIYHFRDARRCLKRHSLIFIGNDRARQHYHGVVGMMNDTLMVRDDEAAHSEPQKSKELNHVLLPLNAQTNPDFSTWAQFYLIDRAFKTDVRDVANKVIRYTSKTSNPNQERKLVFINPLKDLVNQAHLDYLKKLIVYLSNADSQEAFNPYKNARNRQNFIGNIGKIFVLALESDDIYDAALLSFNENLEKFCQSRPNCVFMRSSLHTAVGSIDQRGNYLPRNQSILVPPNIRVNFNLALNYYCNGQQSIKNMKIDDTNCCL